MTNDSSSDLSSIYSFLSVSSDDAGKEEGILKFFHKLSKDRKETYQNVSPQSTKKDRETSPPHEYVFADNPDIALEVGQKIVKVELTWISHFAKFIVMFRNRLADAFPQSLAAFGPQELEDDIVDSIPGERVECFLCTLLKLLLNRQQDVKPGHYNKALEEAVQSNASQWLAVWKENPLAEGRTFATMTPIDRLTLLRALIFWAMSSSKVVHDIIDRIYKGKRNEDDTNIVMSVQPWGSDSDKRRYYLVEGKDDSAFRVYRESNPAGIINRTWWSVAASIEELRTLIEKLENVDGGPKAKKLARRFTEELPRFEATEEKRKRREYRQMRRGQFKRSNQGFSVYEGRTRGKRIKYTYSDDEDFTDSTEIHQSVQYSGTAAQAVHMTTASGRQVRRANRLYPSRELPSIGTDVQGDGDAGLEDAFTRRTRPLRKPASSYPSMKSKIQRERFAQYNGHDTTGDMDNEPGFGDNEDYEHIEDEEDVDYNFQEYNEGLELDARRSTLVTLPVSATLNINTGRWQKVTVPRATITNNDDQC